MICPICKVEEIVPELRDKEPITIYGRNGPRTGFHLVNRCNNRNESNPCRAGFFAGYISYLGHTIYEDDALKRDVLVISDQTGFDTEYLIELKDKIQICHVPFEAEAALFNRFHNRNLPYDVRQKRVEVDQRRICDGWKLFTYQKMSSRYGIKNHQVIHNGDID